MTVILGKDVHRGIAQWCQHNTRYRGCTIVIGVHSIHLRDVVIWRMTDDTLDVAQYGENFSAFIAPLDDIVGIELRGDAEDWLRICID